MLGYLSGEETGLRRTTVGVILSLIHIYPFVGSRRRNRRGRQRGHRHGCKRRCRNRLASLGPIPHLSLIHI